MRPITVSVTGVGNSPTIPMDFRAQVFNVGIQVIVSGTITYNVQVTFDDIYNLAVVPNWTTLAAPFTAATANAVGALTNPVRAMRLNTSAGTGTATMTLIQTSGQG